MTTPTTEPTDRSPGAWRTALALASLAAAGIHFAVVADHFQEHWVHGAFFAAVAWAQALWAVGVLVSGDRRLLVAGLAGNLVVIGTWALSRTVGVPIGLDPWTPEAIASADLAATTLELGIVVGSVFVLSRERSVVSGRLRMRVPALGLALSLIALSTAAIATSSDHGHGAGEEASGHDDHGTEAAAGGGGNEDAGHGHEMVGSGELDLRQIEVIRNAMARYRDVDVAFSEGWEKEHADYPEIGSHFVRASDWSGSGPARPDLDVKDPEFLMYSKFPTGEWKLVAVAYVVDQALYPEPPTTLRGALYHEHVWNCIVDGEELEEDDWGVISREECEVMDGRWSPGGVWMTHVWLIDNPNGIFAETNPELVAF